MQYDLKITGGTVYDGDGGEPRQADIAVRDGVIVAVGDCPGEARETLDASGHIVTPGFIDLHTHYDGQVSWDPELRPSINHGVSTVVMGSCGVGFAPVRREDRDKLVRLMEGVEDIPGIALTEGMSWDWESLPDYLDALERKPHAIDFAVQVTHDPLRVYVMGERAVYNEAATPEDIEAMRRLTREALEAGAIGFSTGRSDVHRSADGDWTPSSEATAEELAGIAAAFQGLDHGVLQAVNDFDLEREGDAFDRELQEKRREQRRKEQEERRREKEREARAQRKERERWERERERARRAREKAGRREMKALESGGPEEGELSGEPSYEEPEEGEIEARKKHPRVQRGKPGSRERDRSPAGRRKRSPSPRRRGGRAVPRAPALQPRPSLRWVLAGYPTTRRSRWSRRRRPRPPCSRSKGCRVRSSSTRRGRWTQPSGDASLPPMRAPAPSSGTRSSRPMRCQRHSSTPRPCSRMSRAWPTGLTSVMPPALSGAWT